MRPIDQTVFPSWNETSEQQVYGNCLQAAMASLLEMPIEEVPHFVTQPRWRQFLMDWCESIGFYYLEVGYAIDGMYGLKMGPSPRKRPDGQNIDHACVAHGHRIIHDPHPSRADLLEAGPFRYAYLVPFNPARFREIKNDVV